MMRTRRWHLRSVYYTESWQPMLTGLAGVGGSRKENHRRNGRHYGWKARQGRARRTGGSNQDECARAGQEKDRGRSQVRSPRATRPIPCVRDPKRRLPSLATLATFCGPPINAIAPFCIPSNSVGDLCLSGRSGRPPSIKRSPSKGPLITAPMSTIDI